MTGNKEMAFLLKGTFKSCYFSIQRLLIICSPLGWISVIRIFLDFCFPGKVAQLILLLTLQNSVIGKQTNRKKLDADARYVTLEFYFHHTAATSPPNLEIKNRQKQKLR